MSDTDKTAETNPLLKTFLGVPIYFSATDNKFYCDLPGEEGATTRVARTDLGTLEKAIERKVTIEPIRALARYRWGSDYKVKTVLLSGPHGKRWRQTSGTLVDPDYEVCEFDQEVATLIDQLDHEIDVLRLRRREAMGRLKLLRPTD